MPAWYSGARPIFHPYASFSMLLAPSQPHLLRFFLSWSMNLGDCPFICLSLSSLLDHWENSEPCIACGLLSEFGNPELDCLEFSLLISTCFHRLCMCLSIFVHIEPGFLYKLTHSLCCACTASEWGLALTLCFLQGHPQSLLNPMYASSPNQHLSLTQMSFSSRNTFQGNSCLLGSIEILQHSGVWSLASWYMSRTCIASWTLQLCDCWKCKRTSWFWGKMGSKSWLHLANTPYPLVLSTVLKTPQLVCSFSKRLNLWGQGEKVEIWKLLSSDSLCFWVNERNSPLPCWSWCFNDSKSWILNQGKVDSI